MSAILYLAAVMVSFTAQSFGALAAGRVLTGATIGIFSSTVPMFIAELSPPAMRGSLVTVNQVCICTGILLGYAATKVLSPSWRIEFVAGVPLASILLLCFIFITPYSPRWLMAKGREEEARKVLMRIRGDNVEAVEAEISGIAKALNTIATSNPYAKLREPHVIWSVVIGVTAATMQQWCGVNAVNAYAQDIFQMAGASVEQSETDAIYIGVAKLGFVIVALLLMDRVGRKPLLLVGCVGMAATLLALGLSLKLAPTPMPSSVGGVATATLVLYMAFFEISLGPVLWLLLSELYPVQVKGIAMSAGSTTCWLFTYVVTQTFLPMKNALGISGVFLLFAGVCFFCTFWIWIYLPETKGRTLEEIETLLMEDTKKGWFRNLGSGYPDDDDESVFNAATPAKKLGDNEDDEEAGMAVSTPSGPSFTSLGSNFKFTSPPAGSASSSAALKTPAAGNAGSSRAGGGPGTAAKTGGKSTSSMPALPASGKSTRSTMSHVSRKTPGGGNALGSPMSEWEEGEVRD